MTKPTTPPDPFASLSAVDLAAVNGGRLIPSKGPSASVIQGIEMLVKTINEVSQVIATKDQAQGQQMMQMMQQLMQRRAGGAR